MEKEQKKKIIWLLIIVLIILGLLFILFKTADNTIKRPSTNETNEPLELTPPSSNLEYNPSVEPAESNTEFDAVNLAKNFVARFGSWSTDSQGHNLTELLPLSTTRMRNYLESMEINPNEEFNGVTTKSLSVQIVFLDETEAELIVSAQRIETKNDLEPRIYYQDAGVQLVRSGGQWLVDSIAWQ
ncbi:MAG: hypothetical protein COV55_02645 [Candidatus Komeilibacteria bacterium CG11_big_fil_rev_8_21_14_0_20_36_20]|uniref:Uncharacterized protein n=1 Tax=Candidatus Komeilibacteria bacterium CG11_big_fil_rev_8_21_14_0_20_36_20 TaxID=1974477 RepID=A0A2H0NCU4_9BACT|nr:MAG: hypothetical protein COV55_02645 [Candidatus Komeilibacteria bacterium CG11_big_fil_rev_8_21_14_0_20_36_20]PIR81498.1 MAG: hypothetical protein COU21_03265 [Candidatus Komeilibacteria bacterium CG10_big_fil_rev_8_21_14_0_10_36_65]PJC55726.1 MAG: hypothetical protein CO027_00555 [Candidatus Komeilibacteria bacterium CG_4_9_14_0_2_um_filter_36_13]